MLTSEQCPTQCLNWASTIMREEKFEVGRTGLATDFGRFIIDRRQYTPAAYDIPKYL